MKMPNLTQTNLIKFDNKNIRPSKKEKIGEWVTNVTTSYGNTK